MWHESMTLIETNPMVSDELRILKKLSKLKKKRGPFLRTLSNGVDEYGPPYFNVEEVEKLVKRAKKLMKTKTDK